jgi:hypothetical protein
MSGRGGGNGDGGRREWEGKTGPNETEQKREDMYMPRGRVRRRGGAWRGRRIGSCLHHLEIDLIFFTFQSSLLQSKLPINELLEQHAQIT